MTNLLLKTKTELFKWPQPQLCNGEERERAREGERERERETRAQTQAQNSDKLQGSVPCFNSKFPVLIVNNTPVFFPSM